MPLVQTCPEAPMISWGVQDALQPQLRVPAAVCMSKQDACQKRNMGWLGWQAVGMLHADASGADMPRNYDDDLKCLVRVF